MFIKHTSHNTHNIIYNWQQTEDCSPWSTDINSKKRMIAILPQMIQYKNL